MSGNGNGFDEARRREPELNERQREVLDLLVAGKTNAEIGEALGITLDGAKWNVSEILTKLGLDSREEAADYWRWRNGGVRHLGRALRGVVTGIPLKAALASAGAFTVGVTALTIWLALAGDERAATSTHPESFYLEASAFIGADQINGSKLAPAAPTDPRAENRLTLRWWYLDADHSRREFEVLTPSLDRQTRVEVYDGKERWSYDGARNRYAEDPLPIPRQPMGLPDIIGPVGAGGIDDFVNRFGTPGDVVEWRRTGSSKLLGRSVETIELQLSRTTGSVAPGAPATTTDAPITRLWFDPWTRFVLKYERSGNPGVIVEVTKLEDGAAIPSEKLRFIPPPGAVRAKSVGDPIGRTTSLGDSGDESTVPATGLLTMTYIPNGYRSENVIRTDIGYSFDMVDDGGDRLSIDQRKRVEGLPTTLKTADVVSLPGGVEGYRRTEGVLRTLAFAKGGIAVLMTTTALSFEELERIATGMTAGQPP